MTIGSLVLVAANRRLRSWARRRSRRSGRWCNRLMLGLAAVLVREGAEHLVQDNGDESAEEDPEQDHTWCRLCPADRPRPPACRRRHDDDPRLVLLWTLRHQRSRILPRTRPPFAGLTGHSCHVPTNGEPARGLWIQSLSRNDSHGVTPPRKVIDSDYCNVECRQRRRRSLSISGRVG